MAKDPTVQSGAAWPPESTTSKSSNRRKASRRKLTSARKTISKPKTRAKPRAKRASRKKKQTNYLTAAMYDIGKELRRLTSGKTKLQGRLNKSRRSLLRLKVREDKMRDKLTKLIAKEGPIQEHQRLLKQAITNLKNRILKVKKIREEIRDPD